MVRGSCLCGDVRWQVDGPMDLMSHCHCSMCRKLHGSAFATWVAAKAEDFSLVRGQEQIRTYESSSGFERAFCGRCGSVVPGSVGGEQFFVAAGCLDDDPEARPLIHIYAGSAASWYTIHDDLPQFEEMPPGIDPATVPDRAPLEPPTRPDALRGSCQCGGAAFEVREVADLIVFCHCSRCRKARSAAHNANLFAEPANLRYLRGEELLETYKVPDAERFGTCFCRVCGSNMPHPHPQGDTTGIPVSALDDDPGTRPRLHIFTGSKAPWFEIADDLPQFEEGPPGV